MRAPCRVSRWAVHLHMSQSSTHGPCSSCCTNLYLRTMPTQADLSAARQEAGGLQAQLAAAHAAANSSTGAFQAQLDAAAAAAERDAASIAGLEARLEDTQRQLAAEQAHSSEQVPK
jgi:hypothetical protein